MQYGFVPSIIEDGVHYLLGDKQLVFPTIMSKGHGWGEYLPPERVQNLNGVETWACTSFALLHVLGVLFKQKYDLSNDWSERYMAIVSGTTRLGNDPHSVAEAARKWGIIDFELLPFDASIESYDMFYSPRPMSEVLAVAGKKFLAKCGIGHAWVWTDESIDLSVKQSLMMKALESSPLTVAVYAWQKDKRGVYVNPLKQPVCHDVSVYDFIEGQYWMAFDSYDNTHKLLDWEFPFSQVKIYALIEGPQVSTFDLQVAWLKGLWAWVISRFQTPINNPPLTMPITSTAPIDVFCIALRDFEGAPGDLNYQNNNPGNCRPSPVGYLPKYGNVTVTHTASGDFAHFPTYVLGWEYLQNTVMHRVELHPDWTFLDFFANWAPASDHNPSVKYATVVAQTCGVLPTSKVSEYLRVVVG